MPLNTSSYNSAAQHEQFQQSGTTMNQSPGRLALRIIFFCRGDCIVQQHSKRTIDICPPDVAHPKAGGLSTQPNTIRANPTTCCTCKPNTKRLCCTCLSPLHLGQALVDVYLSGKTIWILALMRTDSFCYYCTARNQRRHFFGCF